jgi:hypothetical protein
MTIDALLRGSPRVVNVGIREFAESLREQQVEVVHVAWTPPPELDPELDALLEKLL